ncbi:type I-E CRISPR-associated protein Cas6/Cse3/CasE [Aeromicrobium sp. PE09-221]|uniref:type I-E CRISPR-associated protein Cas6/Cse3/CasE n=1 Tax=Aeromicrobium sp. PE09-221 TaxID=1898043 RepID=UPI000B3EBFF2|nr:type I-E CRISPR-associated protein Cas6/Cse3/CasE [Aeromicrobium sp. PE09-221]OUZ08651.1 type I-E CRISPR-associated protein Cas6/Cse3/CasE [Aeromicrobium sp. PE09-221]
MFLTHMRLNPSRGGTRRLLASPQRIHAAVLAGIPDHRDDERVLWRIDQPANHDVNLLVTSERQPDFTGLIEQAGWPARPDITWTTRDYDQLLNRLASGQTWQFRLRGNPVIRRRDDTGRIHTIPHLTARQQRDWLVARAERVGVRFVPDENDEPQVIVSERRTESFTRYASAKGRHVTLATARFDGLLEVTDPEALRTALSAGIGRAKAYGCGLLTLITPR